MARPNGDDSEYYKDDDKDGDKEIHADQDLARPDNGDDDNKAEKDHYDDDDKEINAGQNLNKGFLPRSNEEDGEGKGEGL